MTRERLVDWAILVCGVLMTLLGVLFVTVAGSPNVATLVMILAMVTGVVLAVSAARNLRDREEPADFPGYLTAELVATIMEVNPGFTAGSPYFRARRMTLSERRAWKLGRAADAVKWNWPKYDGGA